MAARPSQAAARAGGGWVRYEWLDTTSGAPQEKLAYIVQVNRDGGRTRPELSPFPLGIATHMNRSLRRARNVLRGQVASITSAPPSSMCAGRQTSLRIAVSHRCISALRCVASVHYACMSLQVRWPTDELCSSNYNAPCAEDAAISLAGSLASLVLTADSNGVPITQAELQAAAVLNLEPVGNFTATVRFARLQRMTRPRLPTHAIDASHTSPRRCSRTRCTPTVCSRPSSGRPRPVA